MNRLNHFVVRAVIAVALALGCASANAVETFERAGVITNLGIASFTVEGQEYRLSATAKLRSSDAARKKFSDFKTGDLIFFQGKILGGTPYVDLIFYYKPFPS